MAKNTDDDNSLKSYAMSPIGIVIIIALVLLVLAIIGGFFNKGRSNFNYINVPRNFDPNYYLKH
jgi:hypothetical protein